MTRRAARTNVRLLPSTFEPWCGSGSQNEVVVLMSGGVDSSVAATLLKESGWKVLGITMKIPVAEKCSHPRPCCGSDAALVCGELGIPHYFLDVQQAFDRLVIAPFRRSYLEGRTPSPCVDCNTFLKFTLVWEFVEKAFGIKHLATGHYARVIHCNGRSFLARGTDETRDQSYFLYGIPRARLTDLVLPLGELSKETVRDLARKRNVQVAEKDDSMELCFAGEGDYRRALEDEEASGGPILDAAGNVIGRHDGIFNYTLGQRRGLRIAAGEPVYVTDISPDENAITVGTREEISRREVCAEDVNVLMPERLRPGELLLGKIRSYGEPCPCRVIEVSPGAVAVEFDVPQFAPCSGQRLVLYDDSGNVVVGGTISREYHDCNSSE